MRALAEVENVIHDAGRNNAVSIAQLEAGLEAGSLSGAAVWRWRRRRNQCHDFTAFAHFNLLALFDPVEDGAEVVPDLPDGRGLHVTQ